MTHNGGFFVPFAAELKLRDKPRPKHLSAIDFSEASNGVKKVLALSGKRKHVLSGFCLYTDSGH